MIDRRAFLGSLAGLIAAPLAAEGQPAEKIPTVGVLSASAGPRGLTVDMARQGLRDQVLEMRAAVELDQVLAAALKGGSGALVQLSSPLFDGRIAGPIAAFTAKRGLPAISMFRSFVEAGGLMSYGPKQAEYLQRPAVYIDKILKGARPADLPIEPAAQFDFVVNLTAKTLGLTIPPALLHRADQVIE